MMLDVLYDRRGVSWHVRESTGHFVPFGVQFWDLARNEPILSPLRVTARPAQGPSRAITARRGPSGYYSFHGLPGLRQWESGEVSSLPAPGLPRTFIVEIGHPAGAYIPTFFRADLPWQGDTPFLSSLSSPRLVPLSPPSGAAPGFYLMASPRYPPVGGFASVRGTVAVRADGSPAAGATVEIEDAEGGLLGIGLCDPLGSFAVWFPYPRLRVDLFGSPPATGPDEAVSRWPVSVRVRYEQAGSVYSDGGFADIAGALSQAYADIVVDELLAPAASAELELRLGTPLLCKTERQSELLIQPNS